MAAKCHFVKVKIVYLLANRCMWNFTAIFKASILKFLNQAYEGILKEEIKDCVSGLK